MFLPPASTNASYSLSWIYLKQDGNVPESPLIKRIEDYDVHRFQFTSTQTTEEAKDLLIKASGK